VSTNSIAIYIKQSAHHFDLRGPDPADPETVTQARDLEAYYVGQYIQEYLNITETSSSTTSSPRI